MPVLNDYGDAGVARIERILQHYAASLGVDKEYAYAFFNGMGRLPQNLQELQTYLNDPSNNPYNWARRDAATGALRGYLHPGDTPGTLGAKDPGFRHVITNAEDTAVQRFKEFDPGIFDYERTMAANPNPSPQGATGGMQRSASAFNQNNYVAPAGTGFVSVVNGASNYFATQNEAENDFNARGGAGPAASPASPTAPATPPSPFASDPGSPLPGADARRAITDANAYGNTQDLQARIDQAIRDYAIARTQEERNAAYLDLQRWQTELGKVQTQQKSVTDMATAVLSAATTLGSRPQDYVKFNQATSGGRDILDQISGHGGPVAAFGGPTGQIQPGSVWDLLGRLGIQYPQTPATPAGVQPGAPLPHNPDLPAVPIPGSPGVPGALQPGATGGAGGTGAPAAQASGLPPSYEQALRELDQAAGGQWSGNRVDKNAVAAAWWGANPSRRGTPMPAVAWG